MYSCADTALKIDQNVFGLSKSLFGRNLGEESFGMIHWQIRKQPYPFTSSRKGESAIAGK